MKALVISNGIEGLEKYYPSNADVHYDFAEIGRDFNPNLQGYDILIVPNGCDHIALYRIREQVRAFLDQGKALFCFDGWFTDWVPGNRWLMDNSKKTAEVRYKIREKLAGIEAFSAEDLSFSQGMTGWWACGYIVPAPHAKVLLEDSWGRAVMVVDRTSTKGLMVLTASGPLVALPSSGEDKAAKAMDELYKAALSWV